MLRATLKSRVIHITLQSKSVKNDHDFPNRVRKKHKAEKATRVAQCLQKSHRKWDENEEKASARKELPK